MCVCVCVCVCVPRVESAPLQENCQLELKRKVMGRMKENNWTSRISQVKNLELFH